MNRTKTSPVENMESSKAYKLAPLPVRLPETLKHILPTEKKRIFSDQGAWTPAARKMLDFPAMENE